jgi:hypothetical protein
MEGEHRLTNQRMDKTAETEQIIATVKQYTKESWDTVKTANGITISKRKFNDKPTAFKVVTTLKNITEKQWLDTFYFNRRDWDESIHPSATVLQQLAEDMRITLDVTKSAAGGLISEREFVNLAVWKWSDDLYCQVGASTSFPHPPTKGIVRGIVYPSGCTLERSGDDWLFTYVVHVNLNGWIAKSVVEGAMSSQLFGYIQTYKAHITKLGHIQ